MPHVDFFCRIVVAPTTPDAKVEDSLQIPQKRIVNTGTHRLQLLLDVRGQYLAGEPVVKSAESRKRTTQISLIFLRSRLLGFHKAFKHLFERNALLAILPHAKDLFDGFS